MKKLNAILKDDLLRHAGILFSGMIVVHVCNMIFQMAVSRALPDAEYSLLMAFLGVLMIIQRPMTTLTTGLSHYSSLLRQDERVGDVKRLLRKWLFLTGLPAVVLGAMTLASKDFIAGFLHLDRVAPVVIAGAVLPALCCLPVLSGAAQGIQLFGWCSASTILGALIRLGLGAGFVWFVYPACGWAMLGHGLGVYVSTAMLLLGLFLLLHGQPGSSFLLPSMRFYLLQSFFIQAAYAVLMTADVVLVKHFIPEDVEFAKAATVFLPGAVVTAMFPKVASRGEGTPSQHAIFLKSFGWTALFVAGAVGGCVVFSGLLSRILFGISDASVELKQTIDWMALVMGFSALLNVVVQFLIAQRRFSQCIVVPIAGVGYLIGAFLFHESGLQIAGLAGVFNLFALLMVLGAVWKKPGNNGERNG
jgi:O-antigen/teichoic acid export membrane protein